MSFLLRYHCAPFCFRYYWSNTDKWQSSSGTGKSVPIRQSFVAFTVAIKSMQMSSNVTKCHIFFIRCELEGHAVSPDTGLDIEIVETIDYQDFFEVFFSNCPNAPMSSLIPSSLMDHILNCHSFPQDHHHPEVHHDADCQGAPWRAILPAGAVLGLRRQDHGQEASTSS